MSTMKHFFASASLCCLLAVAATANAQQNENARAARDKQACARNVYNCKDTPNPLPAFDSVWIEELTWMEVRDAMAAGTKTVIIPTGGVEPNGPWVALGKHTYVLRATCDAIARKLGNALCAPIIKFAPEGDIEARTGHMGSLGTISVELSTYEALVTDIARSMKSHGFENIVLISDNGGSNAAGMKAVAEKLNKAWGTHSVLYVPEYYQSWRGAEEMLVREGVHKAGVSDGVHDDPTVGLIMMLSDPDMLRWSQRVKADKASIDGVSLADKGWALRWGQKLTDYRAKVTAEAVSYTHLTL
ncbi:creatininase family protein, partial [Steroidobacter cummioxidans]|uniref:creatininase family protein n=1 Tax=Steroidobacter cummioxidans TaxID=1803913 RepID=UPI000E320F30